MDIFLQICTTINFPVSMEKTFWGTNRLTFLGLLIDSIDMKIYIPVEKIKKAKDQLEYFLHKENKKVTKREVQKLTGFLNFLCKCIIPGRAFTRRLYNLAKGELKAHHHVYLKRETRLDLWLVYTSVRLSVCVRFLGNFQNRIKCN